MTKRKLRLYIVLLFITASTLSLLLPVVTYVYPDGCREAFTLVDVLSPNRLSQVLSEYTGTFRVRIDKGLVTALGILAVAAILAALFGVATMSRQRPNRWQFAMALAGLIGTAIPAVLIFVMVILSIDYFPGIFYPGVYPIITPLTMVISVMTVTREHQLTQEQLRSIEAAKHLIRPGGDLD